MRSSALKVGTGLLERPRWAKGLAQRVCLVTEPTVYRRYGRGLEAGLRREGIEVLVHSLPTGEAAKTLGSVERLYRAMASAALGRDAGLIALGGGAVTDVGGFAAATYLRGIPWISAPTTLLGQVDSGIGGKTGVNLPEGKNLVGAFHQPRAVVCDLDALRTLPERERVSGLAEALKYGLIFEPALWEYMRTRWPRLVRLDPSALAPVVRRCAAHKLRVVAADERETLGKRELLNFGHTVGHALEAEAGYGRLRHGEAVVWGMRAALALSVAKAGLPWRQARSVGRFLSCVPVPDVGRVDRKRVLERMRRDKKARGGAIRFVLLKAIGRPVVLPVSEAEAAAALEVFA